MACGAGRDSHQVEASAGWEETLGRNVVAGYRASDAAIDANADSLLPRHQGRQAFGLHRAPQAEASGAPACGGPLRWGFGNCSVMVHANQ